MSPLAHRTRVHPAGSGGGRGVVGHNVGTFLQRARSGCGCLARASAGDRCGRSSGRIGIVIPSPGIIAALSTPAAGTRSSWASVSESDGGTRLSFPSTDPGREVFQPNAVVGFCHGRASLPARRLRGPCPAERWSSRAPPPCPVWLYLRFTLSFRDVEDLLAERGLDLSYETVRRSPAGLHSPTQRGVHRLGPPVGRLPPLRRLKALWELTRELWGVPDRRHEPRSMSTVGHSRSRPNRATRSSRCSVPAWSQRLRRRLCCCTAVRSASASGGAIVARSCTPNDCAR